MISHHRLLPVALILPVELVPLVDFDAGKVAVARLSSSSLPTAVVLPPLVLNGLKDSDSSSSES